MYGWQRFLSIEQEFKAVEQYVPYELEDTYSEFFSRMIILLGAEIEVSFKCLCKQIDPDKARGNIGQIKEIILHHYPRIAVWKCAIKVINREIVPFEGWDYGDLEWWSVYTDIKHNSVDENATYRIALKMLGAYEQLLILIEVENPARDEYTGFDRAISGSVWNECDEKGIKAYTVLEMPGLIIPDIQFGIGNGISGLPGMAFYPENVFDRII